MSGWGCYSENHEWGQSIRCKPVQCNEVRQAHRKCSFGSQCSDTKYKLCRFSKKEMCNIKMWGLFQRALVCFLGLGRLQTSFYGLLWSLDWSWPKPWVVLIRMKCHYCAAALSQSLRWGPGGGRTGQFALQPLFLLSHLHFAIAWSTYLH